MIKEYKTYLSGPITGLTYNDAIGWTDYAKIELEKHGIIGFRPLRGKHFLKDVEKMSALGYDTNPLSTERGIYTRDRYDVESCDAMLVNLTGTHRVSIGTMYEMAWADLLHKPIVCVMEKDGSNLHEHAFVRQSITHRVHDIDVGIEIIKLILKD